MAIADYLVTMNNQSTFHALEKISQRDLRGPEWDDYYAALTPWLRNADVDIRKRTINRLCMAVFWSESDTVRGIRIVDTPLAEDDIKRITWLLDTLDAAQMLHQDIIPLALKQLQFQNGDSPDDPLTQWLYRLRASPPPGVNPAMVEGTIVIQQPFDEDNPTDVARLVALLDHSSDYVRACAARAISGLEGDVLNAAEMFALIKEKEIIRPGIAGPYWTEWSFCRESMPVDPIAWMMDILEHRSGPEPEDMPFNGIDFHLHEICSYSPESVLRMMRGGHVQLAIQTATEMLEAVPGMEPVLRQLADHTDEAIRSSAQRHLAHYYRFLHPEAARGMIRHWLDWSPDAEIFSFHWGENKALWFVVIYPRDANASFTDTLAWSLIDKALPPDLRGEVVHSHMDSMKELPPGPYRLGRQLMWQFATGANLSLHGDPDTKSWIRIEIIGAHLRERWTPFTS